MVPGTSYKGSRKKFKKERLHKPKKSFYGGIFVMLLQLAYEIKSAENKFGTIDKIFLGHVCGVFRECNIRIFLKSQQARQRAPLFAKHKRKARYRKIKMYSLKTDLYLMHVVFSLILAKNFNHVFLISKLQLRPHYLICFYTFSHPIRKT